jgi:MraZ protein
MFRGNHITRADEKGRLKIPAGHKRVIDDQYSGGQFYITSKDGKSAEIWPLEEWEKIEQKLAAMPTSDPRVERFLDVTSYWGQVVEIDGQGRVLLPALLREKANLKDDLSVVGRTRYLVVRNDANYRKQMEEASVTGEAAELGI